MKKSLTLLAISLLSASAHAGRPLSVDDANVNEKGVALQAKLQVTAVQEKGCYFAWVFGATVWQKGDGQKSFVAANGSCNILGGSIHSSLMSTRNIEGKNEPSLGLAWEQNFGEWTGHIESVAQRASKPLVGMGLRKDVMPGLQLDGTWGKQGGKAVFSLGSKYTF